MTEITILSNIGDSEFGKFEAIGKVGPGMQVKVVDLKTEEILGENKSGEIRVKGPFSFKGYHKNEKLTKDLIDKDGFIKTGDVGYFDEKENSYIIDRIKDIIVQNGFRFLPVDLDEILVNTRLLKRCV